MIERESFDVIRLEMHYHHCHKSVVVGGSHLLYLVGIEILLEIDKKIEARAAAHV